MARLAVVEDEGVVALDLRELLSALGHDIVGVFDTGEEAAAKLPALEPELVLMDIHLRGKLDGIETAKLLQTPRSTPVLFLTAFADAETVRRASAVGAYGYLIKPFEERELAAAIDVALSKGTLDLDSRAQQHWVRTTLDSIGDAVVAVDASGAMVFANAAALRLLEQPAHRVLHRPAAEVLCFVDEQTMRVLELPAARERSGTAVADAHRPVLLKRANGTAVLVEERSSPTFDAAGLPSGAVIVFRDVSERRRLQERLAQSERLNALGALASGVAHEINNPLAFVHANQQFLLDRIGELQRINRGLFLDDLHQAATESLHGAERIRDVVAGLKGFSEPQRGLSPLLVADVIQEALRLHPAALPPKARLLVDAESGVAVLGDLRELALCLGHLLVNAGQAVSGAGADQVAIRARSLPGSAVIEVTDNGSGIGPAQLAHIFDPFVTNKGAEAGTGLGLSVAYRIAEAHGGSLEASSRPGCSTFTIRLPAHLGPLVEHAPPPSPPQPATSPARLKLLIVDDEPMVLSGLGRLLGNEHDLTMAASGDEALALLQQGQRFDVILSDLLMPDLTGMELHAALCKLDPAQAERMIFLSGGAFTAPARQFLAGMRQRYVQKPFSRVGIEQAIRRLLGQRGG